LKKKSVVSTNTLSRRSLSNGRIHSLKMSHEN
jgi:hypothetical protein